MTLDQMEKVARGLVKYGISVDAKKAAEMLLLLIPVVKAAGAWRDLHGDGWPETRDALEDAIDTMRAALAKENK